MKMIDSIYELMAGHYAPYGQHAQAYAARVLNHLIYGEVLIRPTQAEVSDKLCAQIMVRVAGLVAEYLA